MKTNQKSKQCVHCGEEIAVSAAICPKCGAKNKKPIYKRTWLIVLAVVVVLMILAGSTGGASTAKPASAGAATASAQTSAPITYTSYDVSELIADLENNALSADQKYADQDVELTGTLSNIDSDGKYISLQSADDPYSFTFVQCYVKNEQQLNKVLEMTKGDTVVLKGKIKDVGEVLGYTLDIDEIVS